MTPIYISIGWGCGWSHGHQNDKWKWLRQSNLSPPSRQPACCSAPAADDNRRSGTGVWLLQYVTISWNTLKQFSWYETGRQSAVRKVGGTTSQFIMVYEALMLYNVWAIGTSSLFVVLWVGVTYVSRRHLSFFKTLSWICWKPFLVAFTFSGAKCAAWWASCWIYHFRGAQEPWPPPERRVNGQLWHH